MRTHNIRFMIVLLVTIVGSLLFGGCASAKELYLKPGWAGKHTESSCINNPDGVAYEDARVVYGCGAIEVKVTGSGVWRQKQAHWRVLDASKMWVKVNEGESFSQDQIDKMALAPLQVPVLDNGEKAKLGILGGGMALDAGVSLAARGACHEAGLIASKAMWVSALISGGYWAGSYYRAAKSPLYFSNVKDPMAYLVGAEHTAAGLHGLFHCIL